MRATAPTAAGSALGGGAARLGAGRALRRCRVAAQPRTRAALAAGSHSQMGTSRKQNEDRFVVQARRLTPQTTLARASAKRDTLPSRAPRRRPQTALPVAGATASYFGVFDGHGARHTQHPHSPTRIVRYRALSRHAHCSARITHRSCATLTTHVVPFQAGSQPAAGLLRTWAASSASSSRPATPRRRASSRSHGVSVALRTAHV
jgi:hypothetical protein